MPALQYSKPDASNTIQSIVNGRIPIFAYRNILLQPYLLHPLMNSLKANCLAMELAAIYWNGYILFFASDNNGLL